MKRNVQTGISKNTELCPEVRAALKIIKIYLFIDRATHNIDNAHTVPGVRIINT